MRQCKDKGHISHPQEKPQSTSTGGRGGRGSRWVHYIGGGWGGGLPNLDHIYCQLGDYICYRSHFLDSNPKKSFDCWLRGWGLIFFGPYDMYDPTTTSRIRGLRNHKDESKILLQSLGFLIFCLKTFFLAPPPPQKRGREVIILPWFSWFGSL